MNGNDPQCVIVHLTRTPWNSWCTCVLEQPRDNDIVRGWVDQFFPGWEIDMVEPRAQSARHTRAMLSAWVDS